MICPKSCPMCPTETQASNPVFSIGCARLVQNAIAAISRLRCLSIRPDVTSCVLEPARAIYQAFWRDIQLVECNPIDPRKSTVKLLFSICCIISMLACFRVYLGEKNTKILKISCLLCAGLSELIPDPSTVRKYQASIQLIRVTHR